MQRVTDDPSDWALVGRWVDEHTRTWTYRDLARYGIDSTTLAKVRRGERVRTDARVRISQALGLGDDGLDRMAVGGISPADADRVDGRLTAIEERLARVESAIRDHLR